MWSFFYETVVSKRGNYFKILESIKISLKSLLYHDFLNVDYQNSEPKKIETKVGWNARKFIVAYSKFNTGFLKILAIEFHGLFINMSQC